MDKNDGGFYQIYLFSQNLTLENQLIFSTLDFTFNMDVDGDFLVFTQGENATIYNISTGFPNIVRQVVFNNTIIDLAILEIKIIFYFSDNSMSEYSIIDDAIEDEVV